MINVAVVGAGYWGPNLVRNFIACPDTHLTAICDKDSDRLAQVIAPYPGVEPIDDFNALINRDDIDAVAIATPVGTHGPLAVAAMKAGKHVLVEKPLAASVSEAAAMVRVAADTRRVLMVDHTFLYGSPVRKMKELISTGELGDIYFIDSVRINLGLFQHDVNVVWDLAPHDLSIMDHLLGRLPKSLSVFGSCHIGSRTELEDVAYMNLDFGDGLMASFHVNWLSPVKVRHFIVGGSKKSIVFNDLESAEKIKVYDRGVTLSQDVEARRDVLVGYRTGDVWSPHLDTSEPLQTMVRHFAECIQTGKQPISDGESGLRIVKILEAAQRSIKAQGGRITL